jgi:hypothetical protein
MYTLICFELTTANTSDEASTLKFDANFSYLPSAASKIDIRIKNANVIIVYCSLKNPQTSQLIHDKLQSLDCSYYTKLR